MPIFFDENTPRPFVDPTVPRDRDRTSLERDLQAAAAHPEAHRVHVDVVVERGALPRVRVFGPEVAVARDGRVDERARGLAPVERKMPRSVGSPLFPSPARTGL
jgi:hypothetical protein